MTIEIKFEKAAKTIVLDETITNSIVNQSFDIMHPSDADPGNPFASKVTNPAISSPLVQDSKRFPSVEVSPGNILTMSRGINDLTEENIFRSHELNNKTKEYKKAGRGVPFLLTPIFIQRQRFWKSKETKEFCSSADAMKPNMPNSWNAKICSSCPKNLTKDRNDKCQYVVPVYYLGGTYNKLLKANFKGTNTNVFFKQLLPQIQKAKPMYLVTLLMDTEMIEGKGFKWYNYKVVDAARTPEDIVKLCETVREQLEIYFESKTAASSSATDFNPAALESEEESQS